MCAPQNVEPQYVGDLLLCQSLMLLGIQAKSYQMIFIYCLISLYLFLTEWESKSDSMSHTLMWICPIA